MYRSLIVLLLVFLSGCDSETPKSEWMSQDLTVAENQRQEELLNEIKWIISGVDELAGKDAVEYSELLSLADRTRTDGAKTVYSYDALTTGDSEVPTEAIIVVSDGKIEQAVWPLVLY